jgi:hypothetical protein
MVEEGEDGAEDIGSKIVDRSFATRGYSFSAAPAGARSLHVVCFLSIPERNWRFFFFFDAGNWRFFFFDAENWRCSPCRRYGIQCSGPVDIGYGPGSTVARHGAAQHVVRSITSRFVLIL